MDEGAKGAGRAVRVSVLEARKLHNLAPSRDVNPASCWRRLCILQGGDGFNLAIHPEKSKVEQQKKGERRK